MQNPSQSSGINVSVIAGAVVGGIVLIAVVAITVFLVQRRRKQKPEKADPPIPMESSKSMPESYQAMPAAHRFSTNAQYVKNTTDSFSIGIIHYSELQFEEELGRG